MNRIDRLFKGPDNGRVLIGYATAGFPDVDTSLDIARSLLRGCDILELGIPFSDPVMDGPVIQESSRRALEAGTRVEDIMNIFSALRRETDKPLLAMTYYNPVHRLGPPRFAAEASRSGVDAVLVPDLPPEEMDDWRKAAGEANLATILFASMTTPPDRLEELARLTQGFLYCIAVKGTTGMRERMSDGLANFMSRVRERCDVPLALGLGISTPEQCRHAGELADAVVVGSALVKKAIDALDRGEDPARSAGELAEKLKASLL